MIATSRIVLVMFLWAVCFGATSLGYLGMFMASEFILPGIATVLANTQPLLAAVLAGFVLQERLGHIGWTGMGLGFGGIVLIALPQLFTLEAGSFGLGAAYILLAALGITISNVLIRTIAGKTDPVMAMGAQLMIGGLPLLAGAFVFEDPANVRWSLEFVMILAYWLWGEILATTELNRANAFSFLVPIFGLAMGVAFFGERLGWIEVAGISLSLAGIALANRRPAADDPMTAGALQGEGSEP